MYALSRLLLVVGVAAGGYCAAIAAVICWPASGVIIFVFLAAHVYRKRSVRLTTLGSARWADEGDLRRAGMLNADSGLIVGRLIGGGGTTQRSRLGGVFSWKVGAAEACQQFWLAPRRARDQLVRLAKAVHVAVFSPSGGGKGVSCIIPFLLNCPDSCVVVDFKGENFLRTAKRRRKKFGHQIVVLDPFKVVTQRPDCFNPLDFIEKDSLYVIDECNDLAKALIVRTGEEREPHWNDSAEAWVAGMLATVVQYG